MRQTLRGMRTLWYAWFRNHPPPTNVSPSGSTSSFTFARPIPRFCWLFPKRLGTASVSTPVPKKQSQPMLSNFLFSSTVWRNLQSRNAATPMLLSADGATNWRWSVHWNADSPMRSRRLGNLATFREEQYRKVRAAIIFSVPGSWISSNPLPSKAPVMFLLSPTISRPLFR